LHTAMDALERVMGETDDYATRRKLGEEIDSIKEQIRYTGPYIPDSPGVSRPGWMDDEDWAEYQMSPEYAYEVSYVPDHDPYDDMFFDHFGG
jgi:hypothetical protein